MLEFMLLKTETIKIELLCGTWLKILWTSAASLLVECHALVMIKNYLFILGKCQTLSTLTKKEKQTLPSGYLNL